MPRPTHSRGVSVGLHSSRRCEHRHAVYTVLQFAIGRTFWLSESDKSRAATKTVVTSLFIRCCFHGDLNIMSIRDHIAVPS